MLPSFAEVARREEQVVRVVAQVGLVLGRHACSATQASGYDGERQKAGLHVRETVSQGNVERIGSRISIASM